MVARTVRGATSADVVEERRMSLHSAEFGIYHIRGDFVNRTFSCLTDDDRRQTSLSFYYTAKFRTDHEQRIICWRLFWR